MRVLTYNVLGQRHIKKGQYEEAPKGALKWNYRRSNIIREIQLAKPDIALLQEFDTHDPVFREFLASSQYVRKALRKVFIVRLCVYSFDHVYAHVEGTTEGVCIAWDKNLFEMRRFKRLTFGSHLEDFRGNSAVIVALEATTLKKEPIMCATTHLFWHYAHPEVRQAQLMELETALQEIQTLYAGAPVILGGDLNSDPASQVYQFLTEKCRYDSCYKVIHGAEPQLTTIYTDSKEDVTQENYEKFHGVTLDYIFVRRSFDRKSTVVPTNVQMAAALTASSDEAAERVISEVYSKKEPLALATPFHSSDHYMLIADLKLEENLE